MEMFNDDLDVLEIVQNGFPRRVYDRGNSYFDEMDNLTFFKRFRLRKETVLNILEQIEEDLEYDHERNNSVSPIDQLLTCLRLYATGSHLSLLGDFMGMGMDTGTVSRIIKKVTYLVAGLLPRYVNMPIGHQIVATQNAFFQISSFPRIIGCIDGTHMRIQSPGGDDAELFRNRKGYFSVNVQVVGDADLKIRDVVARWPGSTHDSTIFANSRLRYRMEYGEFPNSILLGDSGYPVRNYMLTPLLQPQNRGERLYNEAQIRTRNSVERLIGVWKRRFPILAYGCRLNLSTFLHIIPATATLHNIAIAMNEDEPPIDEIDIEHLNYLIEVGDIPDLDIVEYRDYGAPMFRNEMINYFENLHHRQF